MKGSELTNLTEAFSGSPKGRGQCFRCGSKQLNDVRRNAWTSNMMVDPPEKCKSTTCICLLRMPQLMPFGNTERSQKVHSSTHNQFLNEDVRLSIFKAPIHAVRLCSPQTSDQMNDPAPGWIYTPFSDITVFVRDKGQVMVGNLRIARACSVNRFAFLLWLYDHYEEEKKVKDRFFSNFNKPIFNNY